MAEWQRSILLLLPFIPTVKPFVLVVSIGLIVAPVLHAEAMPVPNVNFHPEFIYSDQARTFQGIPGIECSPNGRQWATWYGGGTGEGPENYVMVATRANADEPWPNISFVIDPDEEGPLRAFDPVLWHDPTGKLWLFWSMQNGLPSDSSATPELFSIHTEDSESASPTWSKPQLIATGIMMNKPIALSDKRWLLPTAIWGQENSNRVIQSLDSGANWELLGSANIPNPGERNADEPMIVELSDRRPLSPLEAWESFEYSDTNTLNGTRPGSGWTGPWEISNTSNPEIIVSENNISALVLRRGNGILLQPNNGAAIAFRELANSYADGVVYISLLAQNANGGGRFMGLSLYHDSEEELLIGKSSGTGPLMNWGIAQGATIDNSTVSSTSLSLLIVRIDFNEQGNETVRLYINPDQTHEPLSPDTIINSIEIPQFNRIRIAAGYDNGYQSTTNGYFDEIRIGRTFVSVTPPNDHQPLWMLVRTAYGIGESFSTDGGRTWSDVSPSGISNAVSRFFISRIKSGQLLLIRHDTTERLDRSKLTAYYSNDDGLSWSSGLLLDERGGISYPDAVEGPSGTISVIYDRGRYHEKEIIMASLSEAMLLEEQPLDTSQLRLVVNKATGTSYSDWKSTYGIVEESLDSTDTNEDGVPLLVEYALNGNPISLSNRCNFPTLEQGDEGLVYRFQKYRSNISYVIEQSSNLMEWRVIDDFEEMNSGLVTYTLPKTLSPYFLRLKILR